MTRIAAVPVAAPASLLQGAAKVAPAASRDRSVSATGIPRISQPLLKGFAWYAERYVRRHFHSLRISLAGGFPKLGATPVVFFSNHASWWDPLVGLLMSRRFFPERNLYAPMEAAALERYGLFKRLGVFGVDGGSALGGLHFLRRVQAILAQPGNALWLTPQARFADVRERPIHFKGGLGHLPRLIPGSVFIPVAIEYTFWEERLPEILVRFGTPRGTSDLCRHDAAESLGRLMMDLTAVQDALAVESTLRNPGNFEPILRGRVGVGGFYDRWRSLRARLTGRHFIAEHGKL